MRFKSLTCIVFVLIFSAQLAFAADNLEADANTQQYAYIVNSAGNNITICGVETSGILNNCNNVTPTATTATLPILQNPSSLAFYGDTVYFLNDYNIVKCSVSNGSLSSCATVTGITPTIFSSVITIDHDHFYITNSGNMTYSVCNIDKNGDLSSCESKYVGSYADTGGIYGIAISNNNVYLPTQNNGYSLCQNDSFPCVNYSPSSLELFYPVYIAINNSYAYITDSYGENLPYGAITQCAIGVGTTGELHNCSLTNITDNSTNSDFRGLAINNNFIYTTDDHKNKQGLYQYTVCPINSNNGAINNNNCVTVASKLLAFPTQIAIH